MLPPVAFYSNLLAKFILLYFPTTIYSDPLFIRGSRVVALWTTSYILGFIFNNYSSFVNPLLHLILCCDGVYICKIKKIRVSSHTVADISWMVTKRIMKIIETENEVDWRQFSCKKNFVNKRLQYSHTAKSCILKILNSKQNVDCRSCTKTI